ncbi:hypothetical protein AMS68_006176 [Peltaster fructicola]|uniref:Heterokaryon incompatibility domain-containing protein n=1 Tax=Peltaster fructicola TaxID=286661 RepID=A0A6H0Y1B9_9PEZI|nr:hypothetical protein AMS68_006176 [Peltaster fructicola]
MDHFLLPRDPTCRPPKVPYVCSTPYDRGDFLTYPSRGGQQWNHLFTSEWRLAFAMAEHTAPSDDRLLEDFFQRWFWFGLLHAVLCQQDFDLYNAEDFIDRDEDGTPVYVHSRNLAARLQSWSEEIQRESVDKTVVRSRLMAFLQIAHDTLSSLSSVGPSHPNKHTGFNQSIKCSIGDLCGTISAFGEIHLGEDPSAQWNTFHGFATEVDEDTIAHMKQNGWCERDIVEEGWSEYSTAHYWYLKALAGVSPDTDHTACTRDDCKVETVHRGLYRPKHVTVDCDCELLGPEHHDVADALNSGYLPVLEITGDDISSVALTTVKHTEGITYVALSHVWADGLGNPTSLSIHRCQLLRLRRLLEGMKGQTYRWYDGTEVYETRTLHIWIDTLLVPAAMRAGPEDNKEEFDARPEVVQSRMLYKLAMDRMREVYTQANYVLVLDSALCKLSRSSMDAYESIIRVHTSRWMHRLWTYQEAALADKLLIQFADQVVDYRDLAAEAKTGFLVPMSRRLLSPVVLKWMELRSFRGRQDTGGLDLETLPNTMHYRRCTVVSDQPICAATLLGINTGKVALAEGMPLRMATFWRALSESDRMLPDNIIFNVLPRLDIKGFTWAPSTLTNTNEAARRILFVPRRARPAQLSDKGLLVSFPCVEIRACHVPFAMDTPTWQRLAAYTGLLHLRSPDGRWFRVTPAHPDQTSSGQGPWDVINANRASKWHILLDGTDWTDSHTSRFGLLSKISPQASGPPIVSSQLLVAILEFHPANTLVAETAVKHAETIRRGRSFRIYQILFACKSVLDFWVDFLPTRLQDSLKSFYIPRVVAAVEPHLCRIVIQMRSYAERVNQTTAVVEAMDRLSQTGAHAEQFLSTLIGLELVAARASIEKWVAEKQWCVE